jgi:hypothetical protein
VYEVRPPGDSDIRPLAVAVNVDLAETDLTPLDVEEVVASLASAPADEESVQRPGGREARLLSEDQERRQALWRLLLAGAFVLLVMETLVSNWISRSGGRRAFNAGS